MRLPDSLNQKVLKVMLGLGTQNWVIGFILTGLLC